MDAGFRTGGNPTNQVNGQIMTNAVRFMILYKNIFCKTEAKTFSRFPVNFHALLTEPDNNSTISSLQLYILFLVADKL